MLCHLFIYSLFNAFTHSLVESIIHQSIHPYIHILIHLHIYTSMFSPSHQFILHSTIYPPTHLPTYLCTPPTTHPSTHSPPIYPSTPSPACPPRDAGKNQHSPPWSPPGCGGKGGSPPLLSGKMEWVESYYNPDSGSLITLLELEDSPSLAGAGGAGSWRLSVKRQVDWEPEP